MAIGDPWDTSYNPELIAISNEWTGFSQWEPDNSHNIPQNDDSLLDRRGGRFCTEGCGCIDVGASSLSGSRTILPQQLAITVIQDSTGRYSARQKIWGGDGTTVHLQYSKGAWRGRACCGDEKYCDPCKVTTLPNGDPSNCHYANGRFASQKGAFKGEFLDSNDQVNDQFDLGANAYRTREEDWSPNQEIGDLLELDEKLVGADGKKFDSGQPADPLINFANQKVSVSSQSLEMHDKDTCIVDGFTPNKKDGWCRNPIYGTEVVERMLNMAQTMLWDTKSKCIKGGIKSISSPECPNCGTDHCVNSQGDKELQYSTRDDCVDAENVWVKNLTLNYEWVDWDYDRKSCCGGAILNYDHPSRTPQMVKADDPNMENPVCFTPHAEYTLTAPTMSINNQHDRETFLIDTEDYWTLVIRPCAFWRSCGNPNNPEGDSQAGEEIVLNIPVNQLLNDSNFNLTLSDEITPTDPFDSGRTTDRSGFQSRTKWREPQPLWNHTMGSIMGNPAEQLFSSVYPGRVAGPFPGDAINKNRWEWWCSWPDANMDGIADGVLESGGDHLNQDKNGGSAAPGWGSHCDQWTYYEAGPTWWRKADSTLNHKFFGNMLNAKGADRFYGFNLQPQPFKATEEKQNRAKTLEQAAIDHRHWQLCVDHALGKSYCTGTYPGSCDKLKQGECDQFKKGSCAKPEVPAYCKKSCSESIPAGCWRNNGAAADTEIFGFEAVGGAVIDNEAACITELAYLDYEGYFQPEHICKDSTSCENPVARNNARVNTCGGTWNSNCTNKQKCRDSITNGGCDSEWVDAVQCDTKDKCQDANICKSRWTDGAKCLDETSCRDDCKYDANGVLQGIGTWTAGGECDVNNCHLAKATGGCDGSWIPGRRCSQDDCEADPVINPNSCNAEWIQGVGTGGGGWFWNYGPDYFLYYDFIANDEILVTGSGGPANTGIKPGGNCERVSDLARGYIQDHIGFLTKSTCGFAQWVGWYPHSDSANNDFSCPKCEKLIKATCATTGTCKFHDDTFEHAKEADCDTKGKCVGQPGIIDETTCILAGETWEPAKWEACCEWSERCNEQVQQYDAAASLAAGTPVYFFRDAADKDECERSVNDTPPGAGGEWTEECVSIKTFETCIEPELIPEDFADIVLGERQCVFHDGTVVQGIPHPACANGDIGKCAKGFDVNGNRIIINEPNETDCEAAGGIWMPAKLGKVGKTNDYSGYPLRELDHIIKLRVSPDELIGSNAAGTRDSMEYWHETGLFPKGEIASYVNNSCVGTIGSGRIQYASNSSPIKITSRNHFLHDGDLIDVKGVLGNFAANVMSNRERMGIQWEDTIYKPCFGETCDKITWPNSICPYETVCQNANGNKIPNKNPLSCRTGECVDANGKETLKEDASTCLSKEECLDSKAKTVPCQGSTTQAGCKCPSGYGKVVTKTFSCLAKAGQCINTAGDVPVNLNEASCVTKDPECVCAGCGGFSLQDCPPGQWVIYPQYKWLPSGRQHPRDPANEGHCSPSNDWEWTPAVYACNKGGALGCGGSAWLNPGTWVEYCDSNKFFACDGSVIGGEEPDPAPFFVAKNTTIDTFDLYTCDKTPVDGQITNRINLAGDLKCSTVPIDMVCVSNYGVATYEKIVSQFYEVDPKGYGNVQLPTISGPKAGPFNASTCANYGMCVIPFNAEGIDESFMSKEDCTELAKAFSEVHPGLPYTDTKQKYINACFDINGDRDNSQELLDNIFNFADFAKVCRTKHSACIVAGKVDPNLTQAMCSAYGGIWQEPTVSTNLYNNCVVGGTNFDKCWNPATWADKRLVISSGGTGLYGGSIYKACPFTGEWITYNQNLAPDYMIHASPDSFNIEYRENFGGTSKRSEPDANDYYVQIEQKGICPVCCDHFMPEKLTATLNAESSEILNLMGCGVDTCFEPQVCLDDKGNTTAFKNAADCAGAGVDHVWIEDYNSRDMASNDLLAIRYNGSCCGSSGRGSQKSCAHVHTEQNKIPLHDGTGNAVTGPPGGPMSNNGQSCCTGWSGFDPCDCVQDENEFPTCEQFVSRAGECDFTTFGDIVTKGNLTGTCKRKVVVPAGGGVPATFSYYWDFDPCVCYPNNVAMQCEPDIVHPFDTEGSNSCEQQKTKQVPPLSGIHIYDNAASTGCGFIESKSATVDDSCYNYSYGGVPVDNTCPGLPTLKEVAIASSPGSVSLLDVDLEYDGTVWRSEWTLMKEVGTKQCKKLKWDTNCHINDGNGNPKEIIPINADCNGCDMPQAIRRGVFNKNSGKWSEVKNPIDPTKATSHGEVNQQDGHFIRLIMGCGNAIPSIEDGYLNDGGFGPGPHSYKDNGIKLWAEITNCTFHNNNISETLRANRVSDGVRGNYPCFPELVGCTTKDSRLNAPVKYPFVGGVVVDIPDDERKYAFAGTCVNSHHCGPKGPCHKTICCTYVGNDHQYQLEGPLWSGAVACSTGGDISHKCQTIGFDPTPKKPPETFTVYDIINVDHETGAGTLVVNAYPLNSHGREGKQRNCSYSAGTTISVGLADLQDAESDTLGSYPRNNKSKNPLLRGTVLTSPIKDGQAHAWTGTPPGTYYAPELLGIGDSVGREEYGQNNYMLIDVEDVTQLITKNPRKNRHLKYGDIGYGEKVGGGDDETKFLKITDTNRETNKEMPHPFGINPYPVGTQTKSGLSESTMWPRGEILSDNLESLRTIGDINNPGRTGVTLSSLEYLRGNKKITDKFVGLSKIGVKAELEITSFENVYDEDEKAGYCAGNQNYKTFTDCTNNRYVWIPNFLHTVVYNKMSNETSPLGAVPFKEDEKIIISSTIAYRATCRNSRMGYCSTPSGSGKSYDINQCSRYGGKWVQVVNDYPDGDQRLCDAFEGEWVVGIRNDDLDANGFYVDPNNLRPHDLPGRQEDFEKGCPVSCQLKGFYTENACDPLTDDNPKGECHDCIIDLDGTLIGCPLSPVDGAHIVARSSSIYKYLSPSSVRGEIETKDAEELEPLPQAYGFIITDEYHITTNNEGNLSSLEDAPYPDVEDEILYGATIFDYKGWYADPTNNPPGLRPYSPYVSNIDECEKEFREHCLFEKTIKQCTDINGYIILPQQGYHLGIQESKNCHEKVIYNFICFDSTPLGLPNPKPEAYVAVQTPQDCEAADHTVLYDGYFNTPARKVYRSRVDNDAADKVFDFPYSKRVVRDSLFRDKANMFKMGVNEDGRDRVYLDTLERKPSVYNYGPSKRKWKGVIYIGEIAGNQFMDNFATATITFTGDCNIDETITIEDADGVVKTYTAKASSLAADGHFVNTTKVAAASALQASIRHANGHNGMISVQHDGSGVLTLTQRGAGANGNTTITENLTNCTVTDFNGGAKDKEDYSQYTTEENADKFSYWTRHGGAFDVIVGAPVPENNCRDANSDSPVNLDFWLDFPQICCNSRGPLSFWNCEGKCYPHHYDGPAFEDLELAFGKQGNSVIHCNIHETIQGG